MKFWDASALIPLFVDEPATHIMTALARADTDRTVWWGTSTECVSALTRRIRIGQIDQARYNLAITRLATARRLWTEVPPSDAVRNNAEQLLSAYPLRAADALQLAAALAAAEGALKPFAFVCLDDRLTEAARSEGFAAEP